MFLAWCIMDALRANIMRFYSAIHIKHRKQQKARVEGRSAIKMPAPKHIISTPSSRMHSPRDAPDLRPSTLSPPHYHSQAIFHRFTTSYYAKITLHEWRISISFGIFSMWVVNQAMLTTSMSSELDSFQSLVLKLPKYHDLMFPCIFARWNISGPSVLNSLWALSNANGSLKASEQAEWGKKRGMAKEN